MEKTNIRSFSTFFTIITFSLFIFINLSYSNPVENKSDLIISLKWSIEKKHWDDYNETLNATNDISVVPGDRVRLFVEPSEKTYVYLFFHDSKNNLQLIFPKRVENLDNTKYYGKQYTIPENGWISIDNHQKGTERFYLLASNKRLIELELLIKKYLEVSIESKELAKSKVIAKIKNLRRTHNNFLQPTKNPLPISEQKQIKGKELHSGTHNINIVETLNFYSKTIRLEHK